MGIKERLMKIRCPFFIHSELCAMLVERFCIVGLPWRLWMGAPGQKSSNISSQETAHKHIDFRRGFSLELKVSWRQLQREDSWISSSSCCKTTTKESRWDEGEETRTGTFYPHWAGWQMVTQDFGESCHWSTLCGCYISYRSGRPRYELRKQWVIWF